MKVLLLLLTFFAFPALTHAATLSFSASTTPSLGTTFPVYVYVDSETQGFNAAEGTISFPKEMLEVVSIDSSASATIFNFWLTSPEFSNSKGTVVFSGGTTNGVSGNDIPLLTITMRAIGVGDALVTASDASINASDGRGTNILKDIEALRLAVTPGLYLPPKPTPPPPPPPAPAPAPEPEPETPPVIEETPVATTTNPEPSEHSACTGIFADCALSYPTIETVSVTLHEQVGAHVFVAGTAPPDSHVHLLLARDEVPYKEITAVVESDGTWQGTLTNIYAYGVYELSAWATSNDETKHSEAVTAPPIDLYPPFTLHPFGIVLRWYAIGAGLFGILLGLLGATLFWRHVIRREPYRTDGIVLAAIVSLIGFIGMFITSFVLWQKEYRSDVTFWKETDIPCVLRGHSWIDFYGSVSLSITIDGVDQPIPTDLGFSPECAASVHTHDDTGRVHFKPSPRPLTLMDFFTVAGVPFEQEGHTLTGTINGQAADEAALRTRELTDGDVVEMHYITANTSSEE